MNSVFKNIDRWSIIKIERTDSVLYKLFVGWVGDFVSQDEWRINSGISKISRINDTIVVLGFSSNVYEVHENTYGTTPLMKTVWEERTKSLKDNQEVKIKILKRKEALELCKDYQYIK